MKAVKRLIYGILILMALILLAAGALSLYSRQAPASGLTDGHLALCPASPNCVSSEADAADSMHAIAPINLPADTDADQAWQAFVGVIEKLGGHVITNTDSYLHASFTTPLMRYVDDVEAYPDARQRVIHIRSASRVGHSDLGANRKRVEDIRIRFESSHATH